MIRSNLLADSHGRVMRDLRVSVTDRCNFRCLYCLPETEEAADFYRVRFDALKNPSPPTPITREWKPRSQLLSFEEIERVVRLAVELGIEKVRLIKPDVALVDSEVTLKRGNDDGLKFHIVSVLVKHGDTWLTETTRTVKYSQE